MASGGDGKNGEAKSDAGGEVVGGGGEVVGNCEVRNGGGKVGMVTAAVSTSLSAGFSGVATVLAMVIVSFPTLLSSSSSSGEDGGATSDAGGEVDGSWA